MTPEEKHEAWVRKVDWENSYTKIPLHIILPADPGTYTLWPDWPNVPHREPVLAWDINTAANGWCWPITLSGVECETGRPILYPDGRVHETGFDGASWPSMVNYVCAEMKAWADKHESR